MLGQRRRQLTGIEPAMIVVYDQLVITQAEAVLLSHDYYSSPKQDKLHVHKTTYVCHGHP